MLVRVLVVARKDFSHIFENHNLRSPLSSRELSLRWYEVKMPASEIIHVKGLKISILDVEKFLIKRWLWGSKWRYTIGYQLFRWTMSDSSEGSEKPVPELSGRNQIYPKNIWLGDSYEGRNNAFCIGIYHCIIVYNDRICKHRTGEHNKYLWLYGSRFRVSQQRMKSSDVKRICPDNAERKVLSRRERTVL